MSNFKFQRWKCSYVVLLYRKYARKNFGHIQGGTEITTKLQISQKTRKFLCKSPKTSKTAVSSRYKIAVRSQILRFNTENASMLSHCTGNMPGTTLATPKETQRSLQNSKFRQKYENPSIKVQKRLGGCFWPLQPFEVKFYVLTLKMLLCCPIVPAVCQEQLWSHLRRHRDHYKTPNFAKNTKIPL